MSSDEILGIIGLRIREKREDIGITQEDLGNRIGKNKSHISNLENAKYNPTIRSLTSIANALEIEVWELMKPDNVLSPKILESNAALQDFISKLDEKKIDIKSEEFRLLENLRIKGELPGSKEVYLLFWILHRALTKDGLYKIFE